MTLIIDDTGDKTKLTINNGKKTLLKRRGSLIGLLKFVYSNTKKKNVKDSIASLKPMLELMTDSVTKIEIKET